MQPVCMHMCSVPVLVLLTPSWTQALPTVVWTTLSDARPPILSITLLVTTACSQTLKCLAMQGFACKWSKWPDACCHRQGARVEVEGRKRGQFWTFNVVQDDSRGCTISLVRCSTESRNTFQKWLTVSLHAYCKDRPLSPSHRAQSMQCCKERKHGWLAHLQLSVCVMYFPGCSRISRGLGASAV